MEEIENCKYISCCGAGLKGNCYIGVIEAFETYFKQKRTITWQEWTRLNIKGTCGSSAGALMALCINLGLTSKTMKKIMHPIFTDARNLIPNPDIGVLISNYGLDKGVVIRNMVTDALGARGLNNDITFECMYDLTRIDFCCTGTNLNSGTTVYFHKSTHPTMKVIDAIFISASVPLLFAPMEYGGEIYVDGALTANLPIKYPVQETLVLAVDQVDHHSINKWMDFMGAIVGIGINAQKTLEQSLLENVGCNITVNLYPELRNKDSMDMDMDSKALSQLATLGFYQVYKTLCPKLDNLVILLITTIRVIRVTFIDDEHTCELYSST